MYLEIRITPPDATVIAAAQASQQQSDEVLDSADGVIWAGTGTPGAGGLPTDGQVAPSQEPMLDEMARGFVREREILSKYGAVDPASVKKAARSAFRRPTGGTPEGVIDMAGNVWEWCEDWFDKKKTHKVLRGGSWISLAEALRAPSRGRDRLGAGSGDVGFRYVRDVTP